MREILKEYKSRWVLHIIMMAICYFNFFFYIARGGREEWNFLLFEAFICYGVYLTLFLIPLIEIEE